MPSPSGTDARPAEPSRSANPANSTDAAGPADPAQPADPAEPADLVLAAEREHLSQSREYLRLMREDVLALPALGGDRVSIEYLKADLYHRPRPCGTSPTPRCSSAGSTMPRAADG